MNSTLRTLLFFVVLTAAGFAQSAPDFAGQKKKAEEGDAVAQFNAQFNFGYNYAAVREQTAAREQAAREQTAAREQAEQAAVREQTAAREQAEQTAAKMPNSAWFDSIRNNAEAGDASAQRKLGVLYLNGSGVPADFDKAMAWISKAANQGDEEAESIMGWAHLNGKGLPKNEIEAIKWFRKAAEKGSKISGNELRSLLHYEGKATLTGSAVEIIFMLNDIKNPKVEDELVGITSERQKAFHVKLNEIMAYLEWLKDQTNEKERSYTGDEFEDLVRRNQEVQRWFQSVIKAAQENDAIAEDILGDMAAGMYPLIYRDVDYGKAIDWYNKSAKKGFARAQYNIGRMHEKGLGGLLMDAVEAIKWYQKAADQGLPIARTHLGDMYLLGAGLKRNYSEAAKWYKLAADQGFADAQKRLGYMQFLGVGLNQDKKLGRAWLFLSMVKEKKVRNENRNNGRYVFNGVWYNSENPLYNKLISNDKFMEIIMASIPNTVKANMGLLDLVSPEIHDSAGEIAADLFQRIEHNYMDKLLKVALCANSDAQLILGEAYLRGDLGVPRNRVWAHAWLNVANASGNENANRLLDQTDTNYEQKAEAVKRSRELLSRMPKNK